MVTKRKRAKSKRRVTRKSPGAGIVLGKGGSVTLRCKVTRKRKK